jgi:hypothetical protein
MNKETRSTEEEQEFSDSNELRKVLLTLRRFLLNKFYKMELGLGLPLSRLFSKESVWLEMVSSRQSTNCLVLILLISKKLLLYNSEDAKEKDLRETNMCIALH